MGIPGVLQSVGDGSDDNKPLRSESANSSSNARSGSGSSRRSLLLKRSSITKSLRGLESSSRLDYISCNSAGSELSQLYLSSPEDDNTVSGNGSSTCSSSDGGGSSIRRRSSWYELADLYGRRKSFRRLNSYAKFLDVEMMSNINEGDEDSEDEERSMLLIEETTDTEIYRTRRRRNYCCCTRLLLTNKAVIVPLLMIIDLVLGISLSIYDSNLLRNVSGFNFPLCYALVQKLTNAIASLVLICLSRKWEMDTLSKQSVVSSSANPLPPAKVVPAIELPSLQTFKQHVIPLSAVALFQTISSSFANEALTIIPLQLFKVFLMCGPIFVAVITTCIEGQVYSKGRMFALSLIGTGACRSVYAESNEADNPRFIMTGAGYALAASAFSGIGLVLSSVLMHHSASEEGDDDGSVENDYGPTTVTERKSQSNTMAT